MSAVPAPPARVRRVNRGRNHSYVWADSGAKVPGVTSIIKGGLPAPALVRWASNTVAEYAVDHWAELEDLPVSERIAALKGSPWAERDRAALRGTQIHAAGEQVVAGKAVDVPEQLRPHVEAYARFLDAWDVQPVMVERAVYSVRWRYSGTLDLVADLADGRRWLLDVKTGKRVYGDVALQLAAYRYAEHYADEDGTERPMPKVDGCAVVHVRDDDADLVPVTAGPEQHKTFLYVAQVAKFADAASDLIGDVLIPPAREDVA